VNVNVNISAYIIPVFPKIASIFSIFVDLTGGMALLLPEKSGGNAELFLEYPREIGRGAKPQRLGDIGNPIVGIKEVIARDVELFPHEVLHRRQPELLPKGAAEMVF